MGNGSGGKATPPQVFDNGRLEGNETNGNNEQNPRLEYSKDKPSHQSSSSNAKHDEAPPGSRPPHGRHGKGSRPKCNPGPDHAAAEKWYNLGLDGGGTGAGLKGGSADHYTPKQCYIQALGFDPIYGKAWASLGELGGGKLKGTNYTEIQCFIKALDLNKTTKTNIKQKT